MKHIAVRARLFETNSSSVHAIVIPTIVSTKELPKKVHIDDTAYFGWEHGTSMSVEAKIQYALIILWDSMYNCTNDERIKAIEDFVDNLESKFGIKVTFGEEIKERLYNPEEDTYDCPFGGVDHSFEALEFLDAITTNDKLMERYLRVGYIITSNDNDDYDDIDSSIEKYKDDKETVIFIKGN